jgi:hypothetical protein
VRFKNVFGLDEKFSSNVVVGKLGVVIMSFKIVLDCFKMMLQPCEIQFYFACTVNVLLSFCYGLTSLLCQISIF